MRVSWVRCVACAGPLLALAAAGRVAAGEPAPGSPAEMPGLLAYWKLDEGSGKTAADAKQGLRATLKGGRWVPGVKGTAVQFEKAGDYLDYGSSPALNFKAGAPFTFAGWVKTTSGQGAVLSQRNSKDGGANIDLTLNNGRLTALVREDRREVGQHATVTGGEVDDGAWHHFALTRNGRTIELFLDGVSQGKASGADAGGPVTTDLRALGAELLWARTGAGKPYLQGAVDEFCVFDRALSAAEIRKLAGPPRPAVKAKRLLALALKGGAARVEARLKPSDGKDRVRTDSLCKVYEIKLEAGKTYQIDMASKEFDSYLRLEDASGKELAHDDDGGGGFDARIVFRCPAAGSYRIIATTFRGGEGPFTLSVQEKER